MDLKKSFIDPITDLVNQKASRYSLRRPLVEIIEVDGKRLYNYPWKLEIPKSMDDMYIYPQRFQRIEQLSQEHYGTPSLWWVIAQINDLNPLEPLDTDKLLRIPSLTQLIQKGVTK